MRTLFQKIIFIACMAACALLVAFNADVMQAARAGFDLWLNSLMPALLPFFICTSLLNRLDMLPATRPLGLVALSFLSGAPSGARLCGEAYGYGCAPVPLFAVLNVISPMFIYGSFATSMLGISGIAAPVILSQGIAFLICLLFVLRRLDVKETRSIPERGVPFSAALFEAISSSMLAVLNICATVIFFMVLLRLMNSTGLTQLLAYPLQELFRLIGLPGELAVSVLTGFLEVSNGCKTLSAIDLPVRVTASVSAFFFSFGGLCVMAQSAAFARVEARKYLPVKLLQGVLAAAAAYFITPLFLSDAATVFEPFVKERFSNNALSSAMIFSSSLLGVAVVALLASAARQKRRKEKRGI